MRKMWGGRLSLIAGLLLMVATPVQAMPEYWDWWLEEYSATPQAGESVCQLCHRDGDGGDGWNLYGSDIRDRYIILGSGGELDLKEALGLVENNLAIDGITTYLQEITQATQPGWGEGVVNQIYFKVGPPSAPIAPPEGLCGTVDPGSDPLPCAIFDPLPSSIPKGDIEIDLKTVSSGFMAPVDALPAPGESGSIYVVEQGGKIWRVNLTDGQRELFVDLSAQLIANFGGSFGYDERGLLGLAFHPDYANNSLIYTYISKDTVADAAHFSTMPDGVPPDHQSVISEWLIINPQSSPAIASAERALLIIDQPQFNHNGGNLEFGPDGMLYISLGDGGESNDEGVGHVDGGNGRDNTNPLGSILRIDVDSSMPANGRYTVPPDNPLVDQAGLDEIYAWGLRNPYRFSFDDLGDGDFNLYIGDVGQGQIEEIDRVHSDSPIKNLGWNFKEGSYFFYSNDNGTYVSDLPPPGVVLPPLLDPIAEYDHDEGISVIGGHVYRGTEIAALAGRYVFADWGRSFSVPSGRLFYLDEADQQFEFDYGRTPMMYITGVGQDSAGELYVVGSESFDVNSDTGSLNKVVLADTAVCAAIKTAGGKVVPICF